MRYQISCLAERVAEAFRMADLGDYITYPVPATWDGDTAWFVIELSHGVSADSAVCAHSALAEYLGVPAEQLTLSRVPGCLDRIEIRCPVVAG